MDDIIFKKSSWRDIANHLGCLISPSFIQEQLRHFAVSDPHPVGSLRNCELAAEMASLWKTWGIPTVHLQEFFATLPLGPPEGGPWNQVLLTNEDGSVVFHQSQNYVTVPTDTSSHGDVRKGLIATPAKKVVTKRLPVYQAYSCCGSAFGRFVFVNYALPEDLRDFDEAHGRLEGEPSLLCDSSLIAVVRLGMCTRQSKIRALLNHCTCGPNGTPLGKHHPSAIVLYPDPEDFVAVSTLVYPNGPGLPGDAPVFGHVCMSRLGGGNPNTPFLPCSEHVYEEHAMIPGKALTPIPVQPIGYNDASIILSRLDGPTIPKKWRSCLAKNVGPSLSCKLKIECHNQISAEPIRCVNILGVIPGTAEADQYVLFGNHHDAWVQGASDPGSGTAILQQLAKIFGSAYREGFRPRRTLLLACWDGEETSLFGSTHMAEEFYAELRARAVAYVNADCPIKGHTVFNGRTDPLLADVVLNASREVFVESSSNCSCSLFDEWLTAQGKSPGEEPTISPVGGGSDHIAFAYKIGIPCSYPEYLPDNSLFNLPVYHTAYDNIKVAEEFTDPPSRLTGSPLPRHEVIAKLLLTMLVEVSCSVRLPYSIHRFAKTLLKKWEEFRLTTRSKSAELSHLGINLDWITEDLRLFEESTLYLNSRINDWEQMKPQQFPLLVNRLLAGLPQQFIAHDLPSHLSPYPNVIIGPKGYLSNYFPHVRSAFDELFKQSGTVDRQTSINGFKHALSSLSACIRQATGWLQNGLVGFGSPKNAHSGVGGLHCISS